MRQRFDNSGTFSNEATRRLTLFVALHRVLSWRVSNTLDTDFCIDALGDALQRFEAPDIFNTDSEYVWAGSLRWFDPLRDRRTYAVRAGRPWVA